MISLPGRKSVDTSSFKLRKMLDVGGETRTVFNGTRGEMRMPAGAFPARSGLTSGSAMLPRLPSNRAGTNLKLVIIEGGDFAPGAEIS